jgi:hypothetical protein
MAINQDDRNGWQAGGPSADPHHDSTEFSAKPARNGHAQIGAFGDCAPLLRRNGYSPVPIEPGEKRPLGAIGDWNRLRIAPLTDDGSPVWQLNLDQGPHTTMEETALASEIAADAGGVE